MKNAGSKVHPDNRMETCRFCDNGRKDLAEAPAARPRGAEPKHLRRFSATRRVAHLTCALSPMLHTLTGMPLLNPDAARVPIVMKALGRPRVVGLIHRVNAVIFADVFFGHLAYIALRTYRNRWTFRWLGPDSLIPNLQDLKDMIAMFR